MYEVRELMRESVIYVSFYPFSYEISMNSWVNKGVTVDFHLILRVENEIDTIIYGLHWLMKKDTLTKSLI